MNILDQPCRVNERAEVLYFFNGDVCVDVQSGAPERRKAVLVFLAQAQEMARQLRDIHAHYTLGDRTHAKMEKVLRDAGVL